jgi:hypothetical protein
LEGIHYPSKLLLSLWESNFDNKIDILIKISLSNILEFTTLTQFNSGTIRNNSLECFADNCIEFLIG